MSTIRRTFSLSALFIAAALITSCGAKQATGGPNSAQNTDQANAANQSYPAYPGQSDPGTSPGTSPEASRETSREPATDEWITIPAGTVLHVTIDQTVSSGANQSGDGFDASMAEPVVVDGRTVIEHGARIRGEVVEAVPSGRLEHPGSLRLALRSVQLHGSNYDIATSSIARKGASHEKRDAELIGGGAGLGALIGGLAGHGEGALIGAAAGAGAGTAGAAATGKKDVSVPAETALSFRLTESLRVPANR